jgi:hypothetical protein
MHARFGLEGLVSKRAGERLPCRPFADWIKVKNRSHPAMEWVKEAFS